MLGKVFISYAKEDYPYALALYEHLLAHNYTPWLDKQSLLAGSNWDLEIKRALREADFIILLLSSISVSKKGYVQKEYKLALQYWEMRPEEDIFIIPLLIDDCQVPNSLSIFQWLRYEDSAFKSILKSLETQRKRRPIETAKNVSEIPDYAKSFEFSAVDLTIIYFLAQGMKQKDIPEYLQKTNISIVGLSSVEKRLSKMKDALSFTTNEQLVSYCLHMGLIKSPQNESKTGKTQKRTENLAASKKVHDEIANELYRMLATIEHGDGILDKAQLIQKLDKLYNQSRNFGIEEI
jgi:hypothetical protein